MDERLKVFGSPEDKVIEECSEVIKAICKGKRFGWKNWHPQTPETNNAKLVLNEIDDLRRCLNELEAVMTVMANN